MGRRLKIRVTFLFLLTAACASGIPPLRADTAGETAVPQEAAAPREPSAVPEAASPKALSPGTAELPPSLQGAVRERKGGRQVKSVSVGMLQEGGFTELFPNGRRTGYGYEYLQEIAFRSGWDIHYVDARNRAALISLLEAGEIDVLMGMTKTKEREQILLYPTLPQGSRYYYIYIHPYGSKRIERGNAQSVNGARIGVDRGSVSPRLLADWALVNGVEPVVAEYDDDRQKWDDLAAGLLDGVVANDMRLNSHEVPLFTVGSTDFYFTVSKRRPDLLDDINRAQESLMEMRPFYDENLKQRYFTAAVNRQGLAPAEAAWARARGRIRIGYLDGFLPVSANIRGKIEGVYSLIEQTLAGNFGIEIESIPYASEDTLLAALRGQEIDAVFPYLFNYALAEEDGIILSSSPIRIPGIVIQRSDFKRQVQTVAVLKDGSLMKLASRIAYPNASILECSSMKNCLKAINSGRADLLLISNYRLSLIAKNFYSFPDLQMKPNRESLDLCFAVSRDKPVLMEILNKAIAAMNTGDSDSILFSAMSYGYGYSFGEFVHDNAIPLMGGVTFIILLFACFLHYRLAQEQERKRALEQMNTELEATKEALEISSSAAKQASRAKSEFLSKMSHDIRTPLNAIIGFSNLLLSRDGGREQVQDQVGKILLSADHLLGLVNDVLDVSKIESGAMTLNAADFRLSELIASVEQIIRPLAEGKQQDLTVELDEDGEFFADSGRIRQVLLNLLSNAVKYTGSGGRIRFRVDNGPSPAPQRRNVSFVVADNGRGMSDEYMKTLFTPFSREQRPEESTEVGTGLGLPIVKNLVNLMGGTVCVESCLHQGTAFTVRLPLLVSESAAGADGSAGSASGAAGADGAGSAGSGTSTAGRESSGTGAQGGSAAGDSMPGIAGQAGRLLSGHEKPLEGLHILAAEDNELNTEILQAYLTINGAELTVAENGRELLDIFCAAKPGSFDAILMDIQMPVMNGLDATRALRALDRPDAQSIPVIAMSANAFSDDVTASLEAGMNAHIAKPLEIAALLKALEETKVRRDGAE